MTLYLFQAIVLIFTYCHMAILHVMTMLPNESDHFIFLDNITTIEDFYKKSSFDLFKKEQPEKTFHVVAVVEMSGSDDFFTELAILECSYTNSSFDLVDTKKAALEKRFEHPIALIYHPELDTFTGNGLTHAKNIKTSPEIQTLFLTDTDLMGKQRKQYIVVSDFLQMPRNIIENYIKNGRLKINFKPYEADTLNYMLKHELAPEFQKIAKNNLQRIQISKLFISEGYFDTNSPLLTTSPLKVSQVAGKNMLIAYYTDTRESFIISEALDKNIDFARSSKKAAKVACKCRCITF
jgi:hypothetical protein